MKFREVITIPFCLSLCGSRCMAVVFVTRERMQLELGSQCPICIVSSRLCWAFSGTAGLDRYLCVDF